MRPKASTAITATAIAFVLYALDPLGLSAQKSLSISHGLEWITQGTYDSAASDSLAAVIIDDEDLKQWNLDWPLPYAQIGGLIHQLACAKASAVFFDFTLSQEFQPPQDGAALLSAIRDPSRDGQCPSGSRPSAIPVYFGKVAGLRTRYSDAAESMRRLFWIDSYEPDDIYEPSRFEQSELSAVDQDLTPAFGLLRQLCSARRMIGSQRCANFSGVLNSLEPLRLIWSGVVDKHQGQITNTNRCRGYPGLVNLLARAAHLSGQAAIEPCAPILRMAGRDLYRDYAFVRSNGDPSKLLAGRIVFVGTELAGLNDRVDTPLNGNLPGVFRHAMALDNLLTFGDRYPTRPDRSVELVLIALYYLLVEFFTLVLIGRISGNNGMPLGRLIAIVAVSAIFGVIFWRMRWPMSLLIVAMSYYVGADLLAFLLKKKYVAKQ